VELTRGAVAEPLAQLWMAAHVGGTVRPAALTTLASCSPAGMEEESGTTEKAKGRATMAEQTMRSVAYVSDGAAAAADGNEGQYCRIMALNDVTAMKGLYIIWICCLGSVSWLPVELTSPPGFSAMMAGSNHVVISPARIRASVGPSSLRLKLLTAAAPRPANRSVTPSVGSAAPSKSAITNVLFCRAVLMSALVWMVCSS
jgi:hypothetical protein